MTPATNQRSYRSVGLSLGILVSAFYVFLRAGADESFGPLDRDTANRLFLGLWIVAPIAGGLAARGAVNRHLTSLALRLGVVVGLVVTLFPLSGTGLYTCWLDFPAARCFLAPSLKVSLASARCIPNHAAHRQQQAGRGTMIRRFVTLLAIGALAALPISIVSADTTGGPPVPIDVAVVGTGFSFVDRTGATFYGYAQVEDNRLLGLKTTSVTIQGAGALRMCNAGTPRDPSDDYTTNDYVEFYAVSSRIARYQFAPDLSAAAVSLALRGTRVVLHGCTGRLVSERQESHTFRFALNAIGEPSTSVDVFCRSLEDGTTNAVDVTETFSYVDAAGPAYLDGRRVTQEYGSLQHLLVTLGDPCVAVP